MSTTPMSLSDWLDQEIAAAKALAQKSADIRADFAHGFDLGWLTALEKVADRLLNEELAAGAADEIRGNVRKYGVA